MLLKLVILPARCSEISLGTIAKRRPSARARDEPRGPQDAERPVAIIVTLDASRSTFADIVARSPRLAR